MQRPDGASGFKRRDSSLIDGCRESEVSCEWLIGDTIYWLQNGFNALKEPPAGGMQRGRAAGHLAKIVLYYKTHLANGTSVENCTTNSDCVLALNSQYSFKIRDVKSWRRKRKAWPTD